MILKGYLAGHRKSFVNGNSRDMGQFTFHAMMSSLGLAAILQRLSQLDSIIQLLVAEYLVDPGIRSLHEA